MKTGEDVHLVSDDPEDKAVRESSEHRTSLVALNNRTRERVLRDQGDDGLRRLEEVHLPGHDAHARTIDTPRRVLRRQPAESRRGSMRLDAPKHLVPWNAARLSGG